MKNITYILVALFSFQNSIAQENSTFEQANKKYQEGKYKEASELYLSIANQGLKSSELYYNLGTSYYKQRNIGEAIYYFEKAIQENPNNEDAKNNLNYAQNSVVDSIESLPLSVGDKLNKALFSKLSFDSWAVASVILALLAAGLWIAFFFAYSSGIKRSYFTIGLIATLFFVITTTISYTQYYQHLNQSYGIILSDKVKVVSEPSNNGSEVFTLHEGTKIEVLDQVYTWKKIKIANGAIGWLDENSLREL